MSRYCLCSVLILRLTAQGVLATATETPDPVSTTLNRAHKTSAAIELKTGINPAGMTGADLATQAKVAFRARKFEEAWTCANRALEDPTLTDEQRNTVRIVRLGAGLKTERVAELEFADLQAFRTRSPLTRVIANSLFFASFLVGSGGLILLVILTRRRRGQPGWPLTIGWMIATAVLFGAAIFYPLSMAIMGGLLAVCALASLPHDLRFGWFALQPDIDRLRLLRAVGWLATALAFVLGVNTIYQLAYERLAGRLPDLQMVTVFLRTDNALDRILVFAAVVVFVPLTEEVIYRGFLFDLLQRRRSMITAILASSFIFALVHGATAAIPIGAIGLAAAVLRARTNRLWLSAIFHGLINALAIATL